MFLPTTKEEMSALGWDKLDIILVSGDTYVDSPFIGVSIIGKVLIKNGFKVGIIAQPIEADIMRLGEPTLFWAISGGAVDSMVANFTASNKRRRSDDLTPGGENNRRPDRAVIAYSNLVRKYFKNTKPLVLGGLEASLRRIAHYDAWDNKIRRSILFDAKADILVYGMAEKSIVEIAKAIKEEPATKVAVSDIKGICYIAKESKADYLTLPSYEESANDKSKFAEMFKIFYENNCANGKGLCQKQDTRFLIQNPPQPELTQRELDEVYALDFERDVPPYYKEQGPVKGLETIKFSITSHRGCFGECNFCSITAHQGKGVVSRSEESIINEAKKIAKLPDFKGYILDIGGPSANMYGMECSKHLSCKKKRCLTPKICDNLKCSHLPQIELLKKLSKLEGIKKVFVSSGLRFDMIINDEKHGEPYLKEIVNYHTSGQLKIAPEHVEDVVLKLMGKFGTFPLQKFRNEFNRLTKEAGKKQYLTYYFMAAHPGCGMNEMVKLKDYMRKELKMTPEQIQIFTPTPSTYSTLMYHTEKNPFTSERIFVEKDLGNKNKQKEIIISGNKELLNRIDQRRSEPYPIRKKRF